MNILPPERRARIETLTAQLEHFTRVRLNDRRPRHGILDEAKNLIETIRQDERPPKDICATLRAAELNAAPVYPLIAAHLAVLADLYDPKTERNRHD